MLPGQVSEQELRWRWQHLPDQPTVADVEYGTRRYVVARRLHRETGKVLSELTRLVDAEMNLLYGGG